MNSSGLLIELSAVVLFIRRPKGNWKRLVQRSIRLRGVAGLATTFGGGEGAGVGLDCEKAVCLGGGDRAAVGLGGSEGEVVGLGGGRGAAIGLNLSCKPYCSLSFGESR